RRELVEEKEAAGAAQPPSKARTDPVSSGRSVCAPGGMAFSFYCRPGGVGHEASYLVVCGAAGIPDHAEPTLGVSPRAAASNGSPPVSRPGQPRDDPHRVEPE